MQMRNTYMNERRIFKNEIKISNKEEVVELDHGVSHDDWLDASGCG